jgi:hypothetical protein
MVEIPKPPEPEQFMVIRFGSVIKRKPLLHGPAPPIVIIEPAPTPDTLMLGNLLAHKGTSEEALVFESSFSLFEEDVDRVIDELSLDQMRGAWHRGLVNYQLFDPHQIEVRMRVFEDLAEEMSKREQVIRSGPFRRPTR